MHNVAIAAMDSEAATPRTWPGDWSPGDTSGAPSGGTRDGVRPAAGTGPSSAEEGAIMTLDNSDVCRVEDPESRLENALIDEFLLGRGYDAGSFATLSEDDAKRLLKEASVYAGSKLAEVEARAHFVHEIHREK